MKNTILILILILSITAKSQIDTIKVIFSGETQERQLITEMLITANNAFNNYGIYIIEVNDKADVSCELFPFINFIDDDEEEGGEYAGAQNGNTIEIAIYTKKPLVIFTHEIGHYLGLDHVEGNTLMNYAPRNINICSKNKKILFDYDKKDDYLAPCKKKTIVKQKTLEELMEKF